MSNLDDPQNVSHHRPEHSRSEGADWERKTLEKLVFSTLTEQRRARRWGIFFRILGFVFLGILLIVLVAPSGSSMPVRSRPVKSLR